MDETAKKLLEEENYQELHKYALFSLAEQGHYEEGLELLDMLYDIYGERYGYSDVDTLHQLFDVAYCQENLGRYEEATNNFRMIYERLFEKYGEDDEWALDLAIMSMDKLGYHLKGNEALEVTQKALALSVKHFGDKSFRTAMTLQALADALWRFGEKADALENFKLALRILKKLGPKYEQNVIYALKMIGECYHLLRYNRKALPYIEEACKRAAKECGEESFLMLQCDEKLADIYASNEEYQKAAEIYEKIRRVMEERYGGNTNGYYALLRKLAATYGSIEKYQKAQELLEKTYLWTRETMGEDHALRLLLYLAQNYGKCHDHERQLALIKEFADAYRSRHPDDVFYSANTYYYFARSYRDQYKYSAALVFAYKTDNLMPELLDDRNTYIITVRCECASICCHAGEIGMAEEYLRATHDTFERLWPGKEKYMQYEAALADICQYKKDYDGAVQHWTKAVTLHKEHFPGNASGLLEYCGYLAWNFFRKGDYQNAVKCCDDNYSPQSGCSEGEDKTYLWAMQIIRCLAAAKLGDENALAVLEELPADEFPEKFLSSDLLYAKASILFDRGETDKACALAQECVNFCREHYEPQYYRTREAEELLLSFGMPRPADPAPEPEYISDIPEYYEALYDLANEYYGDRGMCQEDMERMEAVYQYRLKTLGEKHEDTLDAMRRLAEAYGNCHKYEKQMKMAEEACRLCTLVLGAEEPVTYEAYYHLGMAYLNAYRFHTAFQLIAGAVDGLIKVVDDPQIYLPWMKMRCSTLRCKVCDLELAEHYMRWAEKDLDRLSVEYAEDLEHEVAAADICRCGKDYDGAIRHAENTIRMCEERGSWDSTRKKAQCNIALCLLWKGDYENAVKRCGEYGCQDGLEQLYAWPLQIIRCRAAAKLGDDSVLTLLEEIPADEISEKSIFSDLLYAKAEILLGRGDVAGALTFAKKCMAFCEENYEPEYYRTREAAKLYDTVKKSVPNAEGRKE